MNNTSRLLLGFALAALAGTALAQAGTTTLSFREVSQRTYTGTDNEFPSNPVVELGMTGATPIGPGRGAGSFIFLNNLLFDPVTSAPAGKVHGFCWTVAHGERPYQGPPQLGVGGPFQAACQIAYLLPGGQIIVAGNLDQTAIELDRRQTLPVVGGTGAYARVRGQMEIVQDPPRQPITYRTTFRLIDASGGLLNYDVEKPAWFGGLEVTAFAQIPAQAGGSGPGGPSTTYEDQDVYLVGNVFDNRPFAPDVRIPVMDPNTGMPVLDRDGNPQIAAVVPAHDDTFTRFRTERSPIDGFGKWVVPGPQATSDNVRARPMPDKSIAGAPLVYAIRLGGSFVPLTSNAVIQAGLRAGLITTRDAGWGGVGWLRLPRDASGLAR